MRAGLLDGADFARLAEPLSIDPSAERGGLLGRVDISALRPELRDAVQGLGHQSVRCRPIPTGFAILTVIPDDEVVAATVGAVNRAVRRPAASSQRWT